jgi:hypothetical protein
VSTSNTEEIIISHVQQLEAGCSVLAVDTFRPQSSDT